MKESTLIILLIVVFVGGALFMLLSNEDRKDAPVISTPNIPSSSMKASVFDATSGTTTPLN